MSMQKHSFRRVKAVLLRYERIKNGLSTLFFHLIEDFLEAVFMTEILHLISNHHSLRAVRRMRI